MHTLSIFAASTIEACLLAALVLAPGAAHASGPVERMAQVIIDPKDPMHVVVRYAAASEGLLFSSDGGRTFAASCSAVIDPELDRLSRSGSLYDSTLRMDSRGRLLFADTSTVWDGDASGCTWTKQADLDGRWIADIEQDPSNPEQMIALSITSTGDGDQIEARSELMRRSGDGVWSVIAPIKPHVARQRAYAAHLIAGKSTQGQRFYATITTSVGPLTATEATTVAVSDDGGKTWIQQPAVPAEQDRLKLVAVDPLNVDRVLAVVEVTDAPDTLLLSDDKGKSFRSYGQINDFSGVAFDPQGRVFIADAGDGSSAASDPSGGVWTAAKLGDSLARVPSTGDPIASIDCVAYDPDSKQLKVCMAQRFGLLDPVSGEYSELTRLDLIERLAQCEGRDLKAICEPQLNAGASWCCTGHFPFTPFCGDYDVTKRDGRRVFCGLSGRVQDEANGNGPVRADAGMSDAGTVGGMEAGTPDSSRPTQTETPRDAGRDAGKRAPPVQEPSRRNDSGGCAAVGGDPGTGLPTLCVLVLAVLLGRLTRRGWRRGDDARPATSAVWPVDTSGKRVRGTLGSVDKVAGLILCCSGLVLSCSDGGDAGASREQTDAGGHDGHMNTQIAPDAGGEEGDAPCTVDYPTYRPGLMTSAEALTIRLISAAPEPPRQKVANDWVIEIATGDGQPVVGATLANPASYMEVHRHYGKTPPVVTAEPESGRYKLNDIDFKMRGPWEVIFDVERAGEKTVTARVKVCVE